MFKIYQKLKKNEITTIWAYTLTLIIYYLAMLLDKLKHFSMSQATVQLNASTSESMVSDPVAEIPGEINGFGAR